MARTPDALVLDVESCNRLAGRPGCGLNRTRPRARGRGGHRHALGPGSRQGSDGTIRRWICREHTCQTVTFLEHDERVCAPRARLGIRAIRWAIRQLRFEGATIAGLARQLATTWNTVWSHIKPCLQAASDDPTRFTGVQVLGVDEHVWHHQDRRRRGPRELTGIVDLTRGKDHPTARLLDLIPGRSGTVYKNWLAERGEQFRSGIQIATLDPFQGYKNTIDDQLQDATSVLDAFHIVKLAADALDEVRRRVQQETPGHRGRKGDPLYQVRLLLRTSRRKKRSLAAVRPWATGISLTTLVAVATVAAYRLAAGIDFGPNTPPPLHPRSTLTNSDRRRSLLERR